MNSMSLSNDRLLQAAVFLIIPAAILLGALMTDSSICIAIVMLVWITLGIFLFFVPNIPEREERS